MMIHTSGCKYRLYGLCIYPALVIGVDFPDNKHSKLVIVRVNVMHPLKITYILNLSMTYQVVSIFLLVSYTHTPPNNGKCPLPKQCVAGYIPVSYTHTHKPQTSQKQEPCALCTTLIKSNTHPDTSWTHDLILRPILIARGDVIWVRAHLQFCF